MLTLRKIARQLMPRWLKQQLRPLDRFPKGGRYLSYKVSHDDIHSGAYKKYLGGGAESWELRGKFQLLLLRRLGLQPDHRLLDVGCGPARAATHLIDYLDTGRYTGVDYNADFIKTARSIVSTRDAHSKHARLEVLDEFDFSILNAQFDYVWAFSVLNHCSGSQRINFFRRVVPVLNEGARIFVTHARWFDEDYLRGEPLITRTLTPADREFDGLSIIDWGWTRPDEIFPIIELRRKN